MPIRLGRSTWQTSTVRSSTTLSTRPGDGVSVGGTEFITVTDSADTIDAGAGNDEIYGRGGDDVITAGTGDD